MLKEAGWWFQSVIKLMGASKQSFNQFCLPRLSYFTDFKAVLP